MSIIASAFECSEHGRPCQGTLQYIGQLEAQVERLRRAEAMAEKQSNDERIWYSALTAPEQYLQQQLRWLHLVIEGDE